MKVKGLISTLLILAMSAGFAVTAMADGAYVSSTNDEGIVVTSDSDMKAKAIVADYDANGRFVNSFTKSAQLVKGDNTYTYSDLGISGISAKRKTMLWKEEGIEPISVPGEMATDMNGYLTACVDDVEAADDAFYIWFNSSSREESELVITADKICNVTLGGETISYEKIKAGDVLTIKCGEDEWLEDMDSYEITVSRATADGVVVMYDTEDMVCTLEDGRSYVDMDLVPRGLKLGTNYRLYLDAFGRIAYAEEIVDYKNVGVIEDVIDLATGYKVKIFKSIGGVDSFEIDEETYNELYNMVYIDDNEKYGLYRRVISYDITDSGKFKLYERLKSSDGEVVTYTPDAGLFDNVKVIMDDFNDDLSTIIHEEELIAGKKYKIWYFGQNAGNTYELAIVQTVQEIENNSPMAVFVSSKVAEIPDEGEMNCITAYIDGEMKEFFTNLDVDLAPGDVFFFLKDADGIITTIEPILKESVPLTYTELYNKALDNTFDMLNSDVVEAFENADDNIFDDDTLVFGAIIDAGSGWIDVATKDTVTDVESVNIDNNTKEYDVADDVTVYEYDYEITGLHPKNRISTASSSIFNYTIPRGAFIDEDQCEVINLMSDVLLSENNADYGKIRFAVLKVVDDEITEALVFRPSNTK